MYFTKNKVCVRHILKMGRIQFCFIKCKDPHLIEYNLKDPHLVVL